MDNEHPDRRTLERFMDGGLSADEGRDVVRHLLTGCVECKRITAAIWREGEAGECREADRPASAGEGSLGADPIARSLEALETRLRRQAGQAPALLAELERHPLPRQLMLLRNSRMFQVLPLVDLLLEQAYQAGFSDPKRAVARAEAAVTLAGRLETGRYGASLVHDVRARAWGFLGNARRISSDLRGAGLAFRQAREALARGSRDPLEEAVLCGHEATLLAELRQFAEAMPLYDRAIAVYQRLGDRHLLGRMLADKGTCLLRANRLDEGVARLREGLELLDPERELRLVLVAKHNLLSSLQESGRLEEAEELLPEVRELHARLDNRLDLLRLRWLEGKLHRDQGRLACAEEAFVAVRDAFIGEEMAFDAALISLDLATVYLGQGRFSELAPLAAQVLEICTALEVHCEALAALALFQQAAERGLVTSGLLAELATYLSRAQSEPDRRSRPSGPR